MKIPWSDLLGLAITFCIILVGSALRCMSYLPLVP